MDSVTLKAYGKVNLSLDITGRRPDGYHLVRMIMQTVDIHDTVTVSRTAGTDITLTTDLPYLPTDSHNIAYKAADLMRQTYGITDGVNIRIDKCIPVAAGMAGGSTDAAAVLSAMNALFDLGCDVDTLKGYGLKLGADVPYCITGGTYLAEGIGEVLTALPPVPSCHVLVVKPKVSASTKEVYGAYDSVERTYHPDVDGMIQAIGSGSICDVAPLLGNVLEEVTAGLYPVITDIKKTMLEGGALNAIMTGSGPTVFGLFEDEDRLNRLVKQFNNNPDIQAAYNTGFINTIEGSMP